LAVELRDTLKLW